MGLGSEADQAHNGSGSLRSTGAFCSFIQGGPRRPGINWQETRSVPSLKGRGGCLLSPGNLTVSFRVGLPPAGGQLAMTERTARGGFDLPNTESTHVVTLGHTALSRHLLCGRDFGVHFGTRHQEAITVPPKPSAPARQSPGRSSGAAKTFCQSCFTIQTQGGSVAFSIAKSSSRRSARPTQMTYAMGRGSISRTSSQEPGRDLGFRDCSLDIRSVRSALPTTSPSI